MLLASLLIAFAMPPEPPSPPEAPAVPASAPKPTAAVVPIEMGQTLTLAPGTTLTLESLLEEWSTTEPDGEPEVAVQVAMTLKHEGTTTRFDTYWSAVLGAQPASVWTRDHQVLVHKVDERRAHVSVHRGLASGQGPTDELWLTRDTQVVEHGHHARAVQFGKGPKGASLLVGLELWVGSNDPEGVALTVTSTEPATFSWASFVYTVDDVQYGEKVKLVRQRRKVAPLTTQAP